MERVFTHSQGCQSELTLGFGPMRGNARRFPRGFPVNLAKRVLR